MSKKERKKERMRRWPMRQRQKAKTGGFHLGREAGKAGEMPLRHTSAPQPKLQKKTWLTGMLSARMFLKFLGLLSCFNVNPIGCHHDTIFSVYLTLMYTAY